MTPIRPRSRQRLATSNHSDYPCLAKRSENKRIEISLSAPATSKISQLPNPKICARTNRTKITTFIFRSTAVGLRSYIGSRNQKTGNNTRKTPDLTAQKPADKLKKTKKLQKQKKPPQTFFPPNVTFVFLFYTILYFFVQSFVFLFYTIFNNISKVNIST